MWWANACLFGSSLPLRAAPALCALVATLGAQRVCAQSGYEPVPFPGEAKRSSEPNQPPPADEPIPFPGKDRTREEQKGAQSELPAPLSPPPLISASPTPAGPEERVEEAPKRERPASGYGGEFVAGVMLIDSSKGALVEPRLSWGLRFTWEWGRLFADETLQEALFADFGWSYAKLSDGTLQVFSDSNYHYFTVAPAYDILFGHKSAYGFYLQLGAGLAYESTSLHVQNTETQLAGFKTLLQYGIGIRGRPLLSEGGKFRISFRFEVTRFRRDYMDDTFIGGSLGAAF